MLTIIELLLFSQCYCRILFVVVELGRLHLVEDLGYIQGIVQADVP